MLVCAGEALVDVTAWVATLPAPGDDTVADAAAMTVGGAFNVMAAAARAGLPVAYAGRHGRGPCGDAVRAALAAEGITAVRPVDGAGDTGFVVSLVDATGERTFVTSPGALARVATEDLAAVPVGPGDTVYLSGYGLASPDGPVLAGWCAGLGDAVTVVFDPGPLVARLPPGLLTRVLARADWVSANRREASVLAGVDADAATLAGILAGRAAVVVRDGPAGCAVSAGGTGRVVAAPVVTAVDTTGAGDTHVGVLIAALASGQAPAEAALRATVAAALSVTRRGPATAPTAAEVDGWFARARRAAAVPGMA